jgi:hypothetical protein
MPPRRCDARELFTRFLAAVASPAHRRTRKSPSGARGVVPPVLFSPQQLSYIYIYRGQEEAVEEAVEEAAEEAAEEKLSRYHILQV